MSVQGEPDGRSRGSGHLCGQHEWIDPRNRGRGRQSWWLWYTVAGTIDGGIECGVFGG